MFENVLYDTSVLDVEAALGLAGRSGLQGEAEVHQVAAGLHAVGRAATCVHETSLEGITYADFVREPQAAPDPLIVNVCIGDHFKDPLYLYVSSESFNVMTVSPVCTFKR